MNTKKLEPIEFAGLNIYPGDKKQIEIPVSRLPTQTWVSIPVQVIYGKKPGPCVALVSGVHGDEINGMEVMREILPHVTPDNLSGCILMVPVVNIFGFLNNSRYLPDRRDLNRSFPGTEKGSMASRLAHLFTQEILKKADFAIDFHTAALGRTNYPQIRVNMRSEKSLELAKTFGAPIIVNSPTIDGSLRHAARKYRCQTIVFEGGEVNRFNNDVIQIALNGVWRVFKKLKMYKLPIKIQNTPPPVLCTKSTWIRAQRSGIFRLFKNPGQRVAEKEVIGVISNIYGDTISKVRTSHSGVIIGMSTDPKIHQGEAIIHIARV